MEKEKIRRAFNLLDNEERLNQSVIPEIVNFLRNGFSNSVSIEYIAEVFINFKNSQGETRLRNFGNYFKQIILGLTPPGNFNWAFEHGRVNKEDNSCSSGSPNYSTFIFVKLILK